MTSHIEIIQLSEKKYISLLPGWVLGCSHRIQAMHMAANRNFKYT